jgi:hypothetical protein
MRKDVEEAIAYFKVLLRQSSGEIQEIHEKAQ